jgi:hypothetical protein
MPGEMPVRSVPPFDHFSSILVMRASSPEVGASLIGPKTAGRSAARQYTAAHIINYPQKTKQNIHHGNLDNQGVRIE